MPESEMSRKDPPHPRNVPRHQLLKREHWAKPKYTSWICVQHKILAYSTIKLEDVSINIRLFYILFCHQTCWKFLMGCKISLKLLNWSNLKNIFHLDIIISFEMFIIWFRHSLWNVYHFMRTFTLKCLQSDVIKHQ